MSFGRSLATRIAFSPAGAAPEGIDVGSLHRRRMTIEHAEYFEYLRTRSALGAMYRRCFLYPRICRRLAGRAIDVGCGIGDMLAYRRQTEGVDVNPHTVAYCRSIGLNAVHMEIDRLPHGADSFDSALLDNVLEHLADPRPLLLEIHRVLRPGGRFVVGVPGRKGWDSDDDHKVYYNEWQERRSTRRWCGRSSCRGACVSTASIKSSRRRRVDSVRRQVPSLAMRFRCESLAVR